MALSIPQSFQGRFMKEGSRAFKGVDEVVLRNIEACIELGNQLRTTFGPNGMKKLVINDIDKEFITTDAATIIRELDVIHPAAQLLALAANFVHEGPGDGVNTSIILAVAFLEEAAQLIRS
uniref:TCP-1-eta n=1 Tax=Panagrolaimus sp. JU765 TaxID=591449 RepID=A0AC34QHU8_9BILA